MAETYVCFNLQPGKTNTKSEVKSVLIGTTGSEERHFSVIHALSYYHTIPHFDTLKIYSCGKHCEKRRNCL